MNNKFRTFMTFKSGKFVFSSNYSTDKTNNLLTQAVILYETVADLPILPKIRAKIDRDIIIKSIFGTAAIEGNPLNEQKVEEVIEHPNPEKNKQRAEKEIANLESAYELVGKLSESPVKVDEEVIKKIHFEVTKDITHKYNTPGHYRQEKVFVGNDAHGGIYTPPEILEDIKNLMKEFVEWIESPEINESGPVIKASLAHYHLGLIHPFSDGNGRTARLLEALILKSAKVKYTPIMLSNYYYNNLDDYFRTFSNAEKNADNDITAFIEFVLKGHISCLRDIKGTIIYFIRKFALADYFQFCRDSKHITLRQYDLLKLMLDNPKDISLPDLINSSPFLLLYRNSSERTARRDLKKLTDQRILLAKDGGKFTLNIKILD